MKHFICEGKNRPPKIGIGIYEKFVLYFVIDHHDHHCALHSSHWKVNPVQSNVNTNQLNFKFTPTTRSIS